MVFHWSPMPRVGARPLEPLQSRRELAAMESIGSRRVPPWLLLHWLDSVLAWLRSLAGDPNAFLPLRPLCSSLPRASLDRWDSAMAHKVAPEPSTVRFALGPHTVGLPRQKVHCPEAALWGGLVGPP